MSLNPKHVSAAVGVAVGIAVTVGGLSIAPAAPVVRHAVVAYCAVPIAQRAELRQAVADALRSAGHRVLVTCAGDAR